MRRFVVLSTALVLLAGPFAGAALAEETSLEQVLIESATTPQQHAALAHYYEEKAAKARKEAEYHRSMARSYSGVKGAQMAEMKDHCDKLAKLADDEAKEYEGMAKMHSGMAK